MSTGAIIGIVIGAVVVLALVTFVVVRQRSREATGRRMQAQVDRAAAAERSEVADRASTEAEERAARAERERRAAEEEATRAEREREAASRLEERARERDPDAEPDER